MSTETNSSSKSGLKSRKRGLTVKALCYTAVLTAMSAVCNMYTVYLGAGNSIGVTFTYIPNFLAGAFFGPFAGFLCGFLGDLLGCLIMPQGAINPIILLSSGLLGLIPGVVFRLFKGKKAAVEHPVLATVVSLLCMLAICTTLNTIGLYVYYFRAKGRTLAAVFALRIPSQILIWSVNSILIVLIRPAMSKLLKIQ